MDHCKYCFRPITEEIRAEKKRRKIVNALNSTFKRIRNGNKSGPKHSKLNTDEIIRMRNKYMKFSDIARELGVSRSYVSRECKKRGIK